MTAAPWPTLSPETLTEAQIRPWLLPLVYERLRAGRGRFLAEIRPAVALFLKATTDTEQMFTNQLIER